MDKEDFYDMLVAFAKSVKSQDNTDDAFSWHLNHLDFTDEEKEEFTEMVS